MQNQRLGKGLSALLNTKISSKVENIEGDKLEFISINLIDGNPSQPRKIFDEQTLNELAESIKANGILQPIVVYKKDERFTIVAGERRWRAAKIANITHMPAVVKSLSDRKILELALIENIQRENLNAIDEAECYCSVMNQFDCTQEELAFAVGKSRSYVANIIRLNELSDNLKQQVRDGVISPSKARSLIGLENAEQIAEQIATQHLNSREVEKIIRHEKQISRNATKAAYTHDRRDDQVDLDAVQDLHSTDLDIIAQMLREKFNVVVEFRKEQGKYKLVFHLNDFEELDKILSKFG